MSRQAAAAQTLLPSRSSGTRPADRRCRRGGTQVEARCAGAHLRGLVLGGDVLHGNIHAVLLELPLADDLRGQAGRGGDRTGRQSGRCRVRQGRCMCGRERAHQRCSRRHHAAAAAPGTTICFPTRLHTRPLCRTLPVSMSACHRLAPDSGLIMFMRRSWFISSACASRPSKRGAANKARVRVVMVASAE